jgi:tetratricopeptide (TPR) repeat protein
MNRTCKSLAWGCAVILMLTIMAYRPALRAGFIWDDDSYVTDNPSLHSLDGLKKIWTQPGAEFRQYYPLTFSGFWVGYQLWKLDPFPYHLTNILLHAVNAILLWFLLRRLELPGAWWVAAVFALHPVQVESVAWITEFKNVLSGMFSLLSLLAYFRFRPLVANSEPAQCNWRFYPLALLLFVCALLSKTAVCCLPVVIVVFLWWKLGGVTKRDALALIPWFVVTVALGLVTMRVENLSLEVDQAAWSSSLLHRGLLAGRALWFYAGKVLWPRQFTFIYPRWEIDTGAAWQYLFPVAVLAVLMVLWLLRKRVGRGPLAAVLCFSIMLSPVLGLFDIYFFRYSYVTDHFQYLACIGLIALAAGTGATVYRRMGERMRRVAALAPATLLLTMGTLTWRQAHIYHDLETLWRDTLMKNPQAWIAHINLGVVLQQAGQLDEAMEHWEQAIRINPDNAEVRYNLGKAWQQLGRPEEAARQYEHALQINLADADTHGRLATALIQLGRTDEAIEHLEESLRIAPDVPKVQNNLAWLLATLPPSQGGDPLRAVHLAQRACSLTGNGTPAYLDTLAVAYAASGRFNDAVLAARNAIERAYATAQSQLASEIEGRLELYRNGRTYQQSADATGGRNP